MSNKNMARRAAVKIKLKTSSGDAGESGRPTLKKGDRGDDVKKMQSLLMENGQKLPQFGADGFWWEETEKAVRAFQKAKGLTVDGICGKETWDALEGKKKKGAGTDSPKGDFDERVKDSFISMTYTDNQGGETDDLQIELDDRDGKWLEWLKDKESAASNKKRPTLKKGDRGDDVKKMQSLLMKNGQKLPQFGADGFWWEETEKAVRAFQKAKGLTADGICGKETWDSLWFVYFE